MGFLDRLFVRDSRSSDVTPITRRLAVVPTSDIPSWLDLTVTQVGRSVRDYLRDGEPSDLEEAKIAANTLVSLISELERRAG